MAFTTNDLQAIETAIAKGELVVQYADRRVQYRSIAELERAKALIETELAKTTRRARQFRVYSRSGY